MLFSLVLAVASEEVELWQAFDDFAPRHLQDVIGEDEELQGGQLSYEDDNDNIPKAIAAGEEEGMGPLLGKVVPVVAFVGVLAVGAFAYKKYNKVKEQAKEKESIINKLTFENLKKGETEALAVTVAAGLALVTAVIYRAKFMGLLFGAAEKTLEEEGLSGLTKFITKTNALYGAGALGGIGAIGTVAYRGYYRMPLWPFFGGKTIQQLEEDVSTLGTKEIEKIATQERLIQEAATAEAAVAAAENGTEEDKKNLPALRAEKTKKDKEVEAAKEATKAVQDEKKAAQQALTTAKNNQ